MSRRLRAATGLAAGTALIAAGLVALHRLGDPFPTSALTGADFELALAATLRLIGLGAGYWLALTSLVYRGALALELPGAARSVGWLTLPGIRRLAEAASARALVAALAAPLPLAGQIDPLYVPVPAGDPPVATTVPTSPPASARPAPSPTVGPLPTPAPPSPGPPSLPPYLQSVPASPSPGPAPGAMMEVVVRPGDNMWRLAESRLALTLGRPPSTSEVAPYWRRVVEANRDLIKSGNPDLIFPGEVLVLPAP